MAPLSPKRQRFVDEYLIDRNGSAAYKRAGYIAKGNSADVNAARLLRNAQVKALIAQGEAKLAARTGITQARVLDELALLAFSDLTHYTVDDNGDVALAPTAPAGAMRALQSIKRRITTRGAGESREVTREVEIRLWDKPGPLKVAGQHVGLFKDKLEVDAAPDSALARAILRALPSDALRALDEAAGQVKTAKATT